MSVRQFVKELNNKQLNLQWSKQNRIQNKLNKQIKEENNYNWKSFWYNNRTNNVFISFKESRKRNFWIKLIYNKLSTLNILLKRKPEIYNSQNRCLLCQKTKKTRKHLF